MRQLQRTSVGVALLMGLAGLILTVLACESFEAGEPGRSDGAVDAPSDGLERDVGPVDFCARSDAATCEAFEAVDKWSNRVTPEGNALSITRALPWRGDASLRVAQDPDAGDAGPTYGYLLVGLNGQSERGLRSQFAIRFNTVGKNPSIIAIMDTRNAYRFVLRASRSGDNVKIELAGGAVFNGNNEINLEKAIEVGYVAPLVWHGVEWHGPPPGSPLLAEARMVGAETFQTLAASGDAGTEAGTARETHGTYIGASALVVAPVSYVGDWSIDYDDWAVWSEP